MRQLEFFSTDWVFDDTKRWDGFFFKKCDRGIVVTFSIKSHYLLEIDIEIKMVVIDIFILCEDAKGETNHCSWICIF